MYSCTLSLTLVLHGMCGQCHALATVPLGKTQHPLYKRLNGLQDWSGWLWKIFSHQSQNLYLFSPQRVTIPTLLYRPNKWTFKIKYAKYVYKSIKVKISHHIQGTLIYICVNSYQWNFWLLRKISLYLIKLTLQGKVYSLPLTQQSDRMSHIKSLYMSSKKCVHMMACCSIFLTHLSH